ncbi:hypothetical protein BH11MYX1_BH11MYX1_26890 [soil metagenome]
MRYLLVLCVACASAPHSTATTRAVDGSLVGLARDRDSGDVIALAQINIRPRGQVVPIKTLTAANGRYNQPHLAPGTYSLSANFAGQHVSVENIELFAGDPTVVDVEFELGKPDPIVVDFGNPKDSEIVHFTPSDRETRIEGTVNVRSTHTRIEGAVVTVTATAAKPTDEALQALSDDQGRYRFAPIKPGNYTVSAYYSVGDGAQIEVRRSDIEVAATEGVRVPLWIETAR